MNDLAKAMLALQIIVDNAPDIAKLLQIIQQQGVTDADVDRAAEDAKELDAIVSAAIMARRERELATSTNDSMGQRSV